MVESAVVSIVRQLPPVVAVLAEAEVVPPAYTIHF
jgi:hypothetical protein